MSTEEMFPGEINHYRLRAPLYYDEHHIRKNKIFITERSANHVNRSCDRYFIKSCIDKSISLPHSRAYTGSNNSNDWQPHHSKQLSSHSNYPVARKEAERNTMMMMMLNC